MWGDAHAHVTNNAWELFKNSNYTVEYSLMNSHMCNIQDGVQWEDLNNLVYFYNYACSYGHTSTHFWDADLGDNQIWSENVCVVNCSYENSYQEILKLWNGNSEIDLYKTGFTPAVGCQNGCAYGNYHFYVEYNGLKNAYINDDNFKVNRMHRVGTSDITIFDPPIPLYTIYSDHNNGRIFSKNFCWTIVGRIIHLLEDNSVPAHSHDDAHPTGNLVCPTNPDYFEESYLPNNYTTKTWQDALSPTITPLNGGPINLYGKSNPIRYLLYMTNQVADRFPSNDKPGDQNFTESYDNYGELLTPFYQRMSAEGISFDAFGGGDPPTNLMPAIRNFSYVFNMRIVSGFMKYVYEQFQIQSYPPPEILEPLIQNPGIIYLGQSGSVTCRLDHQLDPNQFIFTWQEINPGSRPPGVTIEPVGNKLYIHNNTTNAIKSPKEESGPPWMLRCWVSDHSNPPQTVYSQSFQPVVYNIHYYGCPWIAVVQQDSSLYMDNNILHKSQLPQNAGQFITDKYVLSYKPGVFDDKIQLKIMEGAGDSTEYNSVKLYAVHHPAGTKIGVTENNEIVVFDSVAVISTKNATCYDSLYSGRNITYDIQYNIISRNTVLGDTLNHIYAEYTPNMISNPGIIAYLQRDIHAPVSSKQEDAGHFWANTQLGVLEDNFSRRENPSVVIMPLNSNVKSDNSVDSIHLAWNKDFKIKYAAIASLSTSNIMISQLPLIKAYHSTEGEVTVFLQETDSSTSYTTPNSYINLTFSNTPALNKPTSIIDYVFEVNGRVVVPGNGDRAIKSYFDKTKSPSNTKPGLKANFPNPFNPTTKIGFTIIKLDFVKLKVYDLLGREVSTLVNEVKRPGEYLIEFNGSNLSSGVYFYKLETGDFIEIKRMILIK